MLRLPNPGWISVSPSIRQIDVEESPITTGYFMSFIDSLVISRENDAPVMHSVSSNVFLLMRSV